MAKQTVTIGFKMASDKGTAPIRDVAEHAMEVAEAWASLSGSMARLADKLDDLVDGAGTAES